MSFPKRKKKIYVDSTAYNLAGDINNRPIFLKDTIISQALMGHYDSYGSCLTDSYLKGPGIRMKSFYRWAERNNYKDTMEMESPTIKTEVGSAGELTIVNAELANVLGYGVTTISAETGDPDISWWGDAYIIKNRPGLINGNYFADYDEVTNTAVINVYDVMDEELTTVIETIPLPLGNFSTTEEYLYITYVPKEEMQEGVISYGTENVVGSLSDVTSFTLDDTTTTPGSFNLVDLDRTVVTYSDSRPGSDTVNVLSDVAYNYNQVSELYRKETPRISTGEFPENDVTYLQQITDKKSETTITPVSTTTVEIEPGVFQTTVTTNEKDAAVTEYREKDGSSVITLVEWGDPTFYPYVRYSGNLVFDSLFKVATPRGDYFPVTLIKNKQFVTGAMEEAGKKAFGKFSGERKAYDDIIGGLKANPDVEDVDYIYNMFGASLNTKDNAAKEYIFLFFKDHLEYDPDAAIKLQQYANTVANREAAMVYWDQWYQDSLDGVRAPEPVVPSIPSRIPLTSHNIRSAGGLDYTVSWNSIEYSSGSGLIKPGAKRKDVVIDKGAPLIITIKPKVSGYAGAVLGNEREVESITITMQTTPTSWERLTVYGLHSANTIYKGKGVHITAHGALDDVEESGFILPLNNDIFNAMDTVSSTQFTTANSYMILNSYKVVKQKWYETTLFKIILIIVVIVVSIFFPPASGLLGAAGTVGAAVGASAATAVAVGAVVNALAAIVLASVISEYSPKIFGEKWGNIIAVVANVVVADYASAGNLLSTFSAANVLTITNAVVSVGNQIVMESMNRDNEKTAKEVEENNRLTREANSKYYEEFGNQGYINPWELMEATKLRFHVESPDSFLSRTLMGSSDIIDGSFSIIDNFVEINLALPREV